MQSQSVPRMKQICGRGPAKVPSQIYFLRGTASTGLYLKFLFLWFFGWKTKLPEISGFHADAHLKFIFCVTSACRRGNDSYRQAPTGAGGSADKYGDLVTAFVLGAIERLIGTPGQVIRCLAMLRIGGNPKGNGKSNVEIAHRD